jgi:hypothetical protein
MFHFPPAAPISAFSSRPMSRVLLPDSSLPPIRFLHSITPSRRQHAAAPIASFFRRRACKSLRLPNQDRIKPARTFGVPTEKSREQTPRFPFLFRREVIEQAVVFPWLADESLDSHAHILRLLACPKTRREGAIVLGPPAKHRFDMREAALFTRCR